MEGDLIGEIAKLECLKVTVSTSAGAGAVTPSVQSTRVDIGSGTGCAPRNGRRSST